MLSIVVLKIKIQDHIYVLAVEESLCRVSRVREEWKREQSGHQGGSFEWIDSVLVKALQEGHWLLIDNVNFCR